VQCLQLWPFDGREVRASRILDFSQMKNLAPGFATIKTGDIAKGYARATPHLPKVQLLAGTEQTV
jgi:hypothetical protein